MTRTMISIGVGMVAAAVPSICGYDMSRDWQWWMVFGATIGVYWVGMMQMRRR